MESYPEIRRVRHETFLSLTQTSRSLRRFFWRFLWQHIEVCEGMKIGDKSGILNGTRTGSAYLGNPSDATEHKKYAIELVRQLEIVTIRNPLLAQYVNYVDILFGEYSIETVLVELARCLSLFPNLHTVQISLSADDYSRRLRVGRRSLNEIFEQTFEKYSYPQIRNVFVMPLSVSFIASCPQARRVGFTRTVLDPIYRSCPSLQTILYNCPQLEVLEDLGGLFWVYDPFGRATLNNFKFSNFRSIIFNIFPFVVNGFSSCISHYIMEKINHLRLQTIIITIRVPPNAWSQELDARKDKAIEEWIKSAKIVLIHIQLRDNLKKTIVVRDYDSSERQIVIKPISHSSWEKEVLLEVK